MSQKIITLSKQLANQIAAGEVVERPLSVVKELVENALDAGATHIEVKLENGGIESIEVRDNGEGISYEDLPKTIEKYSTSKISSLQDLYEVMTFGFRGEALASISSVSHFTLSSKQAGNTAGNSIFTAGGETPEISQVAHEVGTSVRVEQLFFNTPARLNYLKQARTEYLKIYEYLQKTALSYPERAISLVYDEKQVLHFPENQGFLARVSLIFGEEFSQNILSIEHSFGAFRISGIITDPKISFPQKNKQILFVNQRIIQSPIISKAISDAYHRYISPKMFPGYIIFLEVDPTQVDVNVHPRKMEVRFAQESSLFRSVYHAVENMLQSVSLVDIPNQERNMYISPLREDISTSSDTKKYYTGSGTKFKNYSPYTSTQAHPGQIGLAFSQALLGSQERQQESFVSADLHDTPLGRIIGQLHNSYIVVQTQNGMMMLDQHALAERVIYEKLASSGYIPKVQQILGGIGLHLDTGEYETLEYSQETLHTMGFEIEKLSHGTILIQSIPDFLKKQNIEKVFKAILGDISELGSQGLDEVRHKIWAYTACRSAVKFGDPLSIFEMHALLRDASLDYSATCPHGRPVVYEVGLQELQKKYER